MRSGLTSSLRRLAARSSWSLRKLGRRRRTSGTAELVARLRREYAALPALDPGSLVTEEWLRTRAELRQLVGDRDPRRFLTWQPVIRTMFVGSVPWVRRELAALKREPDWPRWAAAIEEDEMGEPVPYVWRPTSSGNLIHHAHHLMSFERAAGVRVSQLDRVLEFGGGYGSMARLFLRLGFQGSYRVVDLPEFGALQRFFLAGVYGDEPGAELSFETSDHPSGGAAAGDAGLFLGTWSLSEVPVSLRERWAPVMDSFQFFLFGYQSQFDDIDNDAWFRRYSERRADLEWRSSPIAHLPGNHYLFGFPAR